MENIRILRSEYCNIGVFVFFGLVMAGGIVTLALFQIAPALPFDWSFVFAAIWFIVGCAVAYGAYVLLTSFLDRSRAQHDYEIRDEPTREIVREIVKVEPAPALPPPVAPGVTSGLSPEQNERMGDIDREDWQWFCEQIAATKDWTARRWEGITLQRSKYKITNKDTEGKGEPTSYARLIQALVDVGIIVDRSPGQTGRLAVTEPDQMVKLIFSHRKVPQPKRPDPT